MKRLLAERYGRVGRYVLYFVLLAAFGAVAVAAVDKVVGRVWQSNHEATRAARESRVMSWIVETNPQATVKDFAGFPGYLIDVAESRGLDYRLLLAMAAHESGMRPDAVGARGEVGLWQVLPSTAAGIANSLKLDFRPPARGDLGSLRDPRVNALIAAEYFRQQVARFGQGPTALQAYNRGDARARAHWPRDRYAADVALAYLVLVAARRL